MDETLGDRFKRLEEEITEARRSWWQNRADFGGFDWDKAAGHMKAMGIEDMLPHGGTGAHALVASLEFVEKLKHSRPEHGACCGNSSSLGMEIISSNLLPPSVAYIVARSMPQYNMPFEPIQFTEPEDYSLLKMKVFQEYAVGLREPRSALFTCDIGGFDEPRIVWPEPEAPVQPLSGWQWLVIVGVLSWILCAMARAV